MATRDEMRRATAQVPNGRLLLGSTGWELAGFGQHRDSDALDRSNFYTAAKILAGEKAGEVDWDGIGRPWAGDPTESPDWEVGVAIGHWKHWAVGWVEEVLIRSDRADLVEKAQELRDKLDDYPVLDEEDWGARKWEENHPEGDGICYSEEDDCPCGREKA